MASLKWTGALCGVLGGVLFVVITVLNMLVYPGGYVFLEDYFSELGLMMVDGQSNTLGYILFSLACTSTAVCIVLFCLSMRTLFTETRLQRFISWMATAAGIASAPFLSALALFAADVFLLQHAVFTIIFFALYSAAIVLYSVTILFNNRYNRLYSVFGFVVACIALLHISWIHTAAMQKLAVYTMILWSGIQGYRLMQIHER